MFQSLGLYVAEHVNSLMFVGPLDLPSASEQEKTVLHGVQMRCFVATFAHPI